ncbi:MAG: hypothetical protein FWE84_02130 [Firmicutes bacterium]|nr:hypothetical protein [Bacillota bacterium]
MDKTPDTKKAELLQTGQPAPKRHLTLYDKVKRKLDTTRLVFGIISVLVYTVFVLVMLWQSWGSTIYLGIILGFVVLYVLLFAILLILIRKNRPRFKNSLKNYKSGLKILRSLLVLINFGLTVSVFVHAAGAGSQIVNTPFQVTVLIITLTWALFQIVFQINRIIKRNKALRRKKAEGRG